MKHRRRKKLFYQKLGAIGLERGEHSERLFYEAMVENPVPWIERIDWAEKGQKDYDFIVFSDVGKLFVSVKSSMRGIHRGKRKSPSHVCQVLSRPGETKAEVRSRALNEIALIRRRFAQKRGEV